MSLPWEGCRAPWLGDRPPMPCPEDGGSSRVSLVAGLCWRHQLGVNRAQSHQTRLFGVGRGSARAARGCGGSPPCGRIRVAASGGGTRRGSVCTSSFLPVGEGQILARAAGWSEDQWQEGWGSAGEGTTK